MKKIKAIPINQIDLERSPNSRAAPNTATVEEYIELYKQKVKFPPVVLFDDEEKENYYLADGFHRASALARRHGKNPEELDGRIKIRAEIHKGDLRACTLYAVGANHEHGLRRSTADKRKAIKLLLEDNEWKNKSNNWIAEQCKVSNDLVTKVKEEIGIGKPKVTLGKDGKKRDTSRIGQHKKKGKAKDSKPDPLAEDTRPDAKEKGKKESAGRFTSLAGMECAVVGTKPPFFETRYDQPNKEPTVCGPVYCGHVKGWKEEGMAVEVGGKIQVIVQAHDSPEETSTITITYCPECGQEITPHIIQ